MWSRHLIAIARERRDATPSSRPYGSRARRILAAGTTAPLLLAVAGGLIGGTPTAVGAWLGLTIGVLASGCIWWVLRGATRLLVDTPAAALDERESGEQATALACAYRITMAVLSALVALSALSALSSGRTLPMETWPSILAGALLTSAMLPTAVAAWRWTEPHPDHR